MAALPLLLWVLPFALVRAPHFAQWSTSAFGRNLEYAYAARGIDADVLVFGDSTALYGIDAQAMSATLGVKVFNLPEIRPALEVTHDLALQQYLRQNRAPRLLVVYLPPWNLDFAHAAIRDAPYDGDEMLLRHGTLAEIAGFYREHALEMLSFPLRFYRVQSLSGLGALARPAVPPDVARLQGHLPIGTYQALPANCALSPALQQQAFQARTARELAARYSTATTRVLVYVAPMAACQGTQRWLAEDYRAIPAAVPHLLPPADVAQEGYFVHPNTAGVPVTTELLTEAVRPLLRP